MRKYLISLLIRDMQMYMTLIYFFSSITSKTPRPGRHPLNKAVGTQAVPQAACETMRFDIYWSFAPAIPLLGSDDPKVRPLTKQEHIYMNVLQNKIHMKPCHCKILEITQIHRKLDEETMLDPLKGRYATRRARRTSVNWHDAVTSRINF